MLKKDDAQNALLQQYKTHTEAQSKIQTNADVSKTSAVDSLKRPEMIKLKKVFVEELVPKLAEAIKASNLFINLGEHGKGFLPENIASNIFDKHFLSVLEKKDSKQQDEILRSVIEGSLLIAAGNPIYGTTAFNGMVDHLQKVCKTHMNSPHSVKNTTVIEDIVPRKETSEDAPQSRLMDSGWEGTDSFRTYAPRINPQGWEGTDSFFLPDDHMDPWTGRRVSNL